MLHTIISMYKMTIKVTIKGASEHLLYELLYIITSLVIGHLKCYLERNSTIILNNYRIFLQNINYDVLVMRVICFKSFVEKFK